MKRARKAGSLWQRRKAACTRAAGRFLRTGRRSFKRLAFLLRELRGWTVREGGGSWLPGSFLGPRARPKKYKPMRRGSVRWSSSVVGAPGGWRRFMQIASGSSELGAVHGRHLPRVGGLS